MNVTPIKFIAMFLMLIGLCVNAKVVEESFSVAKGGTLDLRTDIGSIRVNTHNEDTVLMKVSIEGKSADEFELNFSESGADVEVTGEMDRQNGWSWGRNLRVKFEFVVPNAYNLDVNTAGGSISIDDLVGNVEAETSGGSIKVGNIEGDVRVHTSGGSIKSKDIKGHVDANTSGGSIKVTITEPLSKDARLTTSGGSITANIHPDSKIDIHASTSGGRVSSEFEIDGKVTKRSVRGEINGGGPKLTLRTSGGSININSL